MRGARMAPALSRREQEVAELVAEGLTDRQIAGRLFISERTVEGHVHHVRNKLGLDNRTQVARWITTRKLQQAAAAPESPAEPAPPPNNLPVQLTTFVGRERDLGEIRRLLQRARLVTVTGPGGCGKTRLAVQAAAEVLHRYPVGLWFVDLGSVSDRNVVPREIAAALGVSEREGSDPLEAIAAGLATSRRRRQVLVILDNCEHLVRECAATVDALLRACPDLTFLATSREPLRVSGEAVWTLGPLPLPGLGRRPWLEVARESEAIQLFLDRVGLHDPEFELSEENAANVVHLCQQLDGIPLALELAAPRIGLMSFAQVLGRLEERIHSLATHGVTDRHETLSATIDWSHDLLTEAERRLLRRLSVFRGGFTPEAAEAVFDAGPAPGDGAFDILVRLVQKSLVLPVPPRRERYRCLELIRRYAVDRLAEGGELAEVRRRHFEHFFAFAEQAAGELTGPAQPAWLERLAAEHDNLRAALEFSRGEDLERRLRFVLALDRFWHVHGYLGEAREWAEDVLGESADRAPAPLRARVLTAAGGFAWHQGDLSSAAVSSPGHGGTWRPRVAAIARASRWRARPGTGARPASCSATSA
jgi:predicted ATPase/DNA-binding CsgD family transcriptional regulator